jgi:putative hydrolase of the HAD superfamily
MSVRAVIFDWGGTLTPWHTIEPVLSWQAAVQDEALAAELLAAENVMWTRSRDEHRSATLAEVFASVGLEPTEIMLGAYHDWWTPHTYIDPDVRPLFGGLRERGIKIGVLSNTIWPREVHEEIFRRDEVLDLIDGAVYTSEIPWTKPHPDAFRAALEAVAVDEPGDAVFVGDRPFDDIHGAKSVGMRAVLVPHSTIPVQQVGHTVGEPDAVIDRLADVLPLVDAWDDRPL